MRSRSSMSENIVMAVRYDSPMRTRGSSRLLFVIEAAVVLTTIGLAASLPSAPQYVKCLGCLDDEPPSDPHRIALRLLIVVAGLLVIAALETFRPVAHRNKNDDKGQTEAG
jgi:hypothetical protein